MSMPQRRDRVGQTEPTMIGRRRSRIALFALPVLLAGCDAGLERMLDLLTGLERNVVILARQPVTLPQQPTTLTSPQPMKVLGRDWTSLCFALGGGVALADTNAMDRAFDEAMKGARISVHVTLDNGERIALGRPMQAWSRYGTILERDELSACASAPCGTRLPVGSQIAKVEVSAEPPLQVRGIYWRSEQAIGEAGESAPDAKMPEALKGSTSCR